MKKYILFFIILGVYIPLTYAQETCPLSPPCAVYNCAVPNSNKVCTDLLEGVPCSSLEGGDCIVDQNCAYGGIETINGMRVCKAVISPTGIAAFMSFIAMIYRYASWAIGILAVLVIIIGGIMMSIGGANQESVTKGKKLIFQAIGGVILFFLIGVILHTINPNFF